MNTRTVTILDTLAMSFWFVLLSVVAGFVVSVLLALLLNALTALFLDAVVQALRLDYLDTLLINFAVTFLAVLAFIVSQTVKRVRKRLYPVPVPDAFRPRPP